MSFIKSVFGDKSLIGAEIGVCEGEHALIMLRGLKLKHLYLVDIWDKYVCDGKKYDYNYLYFIVKNKFSIYKNVEIIRGESSLIATTFLNNILNFVYIDGNHQYEFIKKDILSWYPKVKIEGYLCGHDYTLLCPGVIKAVDEFVAQNNLKLFVNDTDWWFKKEKGL
jgi:hypothetical protein